MQCPACTQSLSQVFAGDIELDICRVGCHGIWFDRDELLKFDEPHEFNVTAVYQLTGSPKISTPSCEQRFCPRCENEPLVRQFIDHQNHIEMDQCWSCGGVWLDVGELDALRAQYKTMEDRAKAANELTDGALEQHKRMLEQSSNEEIARYSEQNKDRFRTAVNAFRRLLGL